MSVFGRCKPINAKSELFKYIINSLSEFYKKREITCVAGIEARGFVFRAALAYDLQTSFIPIRKKGKLQRQKLTRKYQLEYGEDQIEVHSDALKNGDRVLIIDGIIATGGTAIASCELIGSFENV